ncbi:DnaB-like helicase N-terminal domain-containing protein [Streptomyces sp. TLI_171]|uniref:DnaB-like helicase N-terminal domain-containing protein n=1 Tax=Streptomyces sp. TLI_171 TaxID=1938859 RepID=UPI000C19FBF8|nr:DnaB-like helicase N-terminal domain-containing protein [Streptomyces sp. TLI_171]RKE22005.1 DnaB helicase-like protein [Streptomyces sp. TLI_171]
MEPLLAGEQALLGAVLLDPRQLRRLEWLEPRDFHRPAHRVLFSALRELRDAGHPGFAADSDHGEVPLEWLTDTLALAGERTRGLDPSYLHTLIAACPRPGHAPLYGRIVLEGSIRRTVTEHAERLLAVAEEGLAAGEVEGTAHQADVLAGVLADLAGRWGTPPRTQKPAAVPAPAAAPAAELSDDALADEQFLLALLVHQDGALQGVFDWLRPGDFADPGHGRLYRCLGALHHRGEPIDSVTALWEVQRRGLLADGTLTEEQLTPVLGAHLVAGSAEWLGEQVLRASLTRTAGHSARQITALAADERLAPGQLVGQALHALGPLEEVRARWRTANGHPSPGTDRAAPAADVPAARVSAALSRSTPQPPVYRTAPAAARTGAAPAPRRRPSSFPLRSAQ